MLRRYVPLRSRKLWRHKPRAEEDKVSADLRRYILTRDQMCIQARVEPQHVCRDMMGTPHAPTALNRLTLEHVKDNPRMGRRAESDKWHLVAACWAANVLGWCSANRAICKSWIAQVEPNA